MLSCEQQSDRCRLAVMEMNKHGTYPYEICLNVHVTQRGWYPYLMSDACCLHSLMFSIRAFKDGLPHTKLGPLSCFHYIQTLKTLQARLDDFNVASVISDATIMAITILSAAAELTLDLETLGNHVKGLNTIVRLRGGLAALNTHNNLAVKVSRYVGSSH